MSVSSPVDRVKSLSYVATSPRSRHGIEKRSSLMLMGSRDSTPKKRPEDYRVARFDGISDAVIRAAEEARRWIEVGDQPDSQWKAPFQLPAHNAFLFPRLRNVPKWTSRRSIFERRCAMASCSAGMAFNADLLGDRAAEHAGAEFCCFLTGWPTASSQGLSRRKFEKRRRLSFGWWVTRDLEWASHAS